MLAADESLLADRGFETLGQPASPWLLTPEEAGTAEPTTADGFQGKVLHLKAAKVSQDVPLAGGVYEVAAIAWGSGELSLDAKGIGERTQRLAKDRGTYGYLFECPPGNITVSVWPLHV